VIWIMFMGNRDHMILAVKIRLPEFLTAAAVEAM